MGYFSNSKEIVLALLAGERHPDSATASYLAVRLECNKTVVTADGVVTDAPAHLLGIFVNTAGTLISLYDNASTNSGDSFNFATTGVGAQNLAGAAAMNNGIYADITGGEVVVLWRPI